MNEPNPTPAPAAPTNGKRRRILTIIITAFLLLGIGWLLLWVLVLSKRETTDDAYVGGDQVGITAQVIGTVIEVLADDTQRVDAGQVLVQLDPTDAEVALSKAASTLSLAVRQVRQQSATATQFDAQIDSRRSELEQAQAQLARRQPLLATQAISAEELRNAETAVATARAALQGAQRQSAAAHVIVDGTPVEKNPAVLEARAAFEQAWISLRRTTLRAPVTGYVAQRSVQIGQQVQPGQPLLNVVPLNRLWVDANFKESQLRALRIGQPAELQSDLYGSSFKFQGRVLGAAAGTGAAFSLLPAQNASGNWIKVVQRVPVRIGLDPQQLASHPLRIGLSIDVNVDTRDRSGNLLASTAANTPVATTALYAGDAAAAAHAADAIIHGDALEQP
ncbi:MAG TPA: efflux RND transporter periplasmic adaptor subunit [Steroidobacteraceae bacterium]|nr:efflux RND transporter periplasmic adaptor subunit [Steroidobacteraceae bacterium]